MKGNKAVIMHEQFQVLNTQSLGTNTASVASTDCNG